jgi:hypothetical protein
MNCIRNEKNMGDTQKHRQHGDLMSFIKLISLLFLNKENRLKINLKIFGREVVDWTPVTG